MKPMMNMKKFYTIIIALVALICVPSCKDQDEIYKDFVVPNGYRYPQKADSLKAFSGYNRLLVQWYKSVDPSVTRAKLFWNTGLDSMEVELSSFPTDTVKVYVEGLEESTYTISVFTYDSKGNKSVPAEISGSAYGPSLASSLVDREITKAGMVTSTLANFVFSKASSELVYSELRYLSTSGEYKTIKIMPETTSLQIDDFDNSEPYSFRSVFLPKKGIDIIEKDWYTNEGTLPEDVIELPKGPWTHLKLPTDTYSAWGGLSDLFQVRKLWDGNLRSDNNIWASPEVPKDMWFTIDLGYSVSLRRMQMFHRSIEVYSGDAIRHFQIWGSNDPNPDGSWDDSWTLLGDFEPYKPSGYNADGTPGPVTAEDLDYWTNTNEFFFDPEVTPDAYKEVRYIRVRLLDSFNSFANKTATAYYVFGELTLHGMMTNLEERNKYYHN